MYTVKETRRAKGISVEKMAKLLGVHPNTYSNWENKPSKISMSYAIKICEIFEKDINEVSFLP